MFGASVGDMLVMKGDDGDSGKVRLSESFRFFNGIYKELYVNINGGISFKKAMTSFTPQDFPMEAKTPLIAPYWADVDTRKGGKIWYRQSTNQRDLDAATAQIRAFHGAKYADFRATWAFIATWDNVPFYHASRSRGRKRRCTFQGVLVVDASTHMSFAILNYAKLQWVAGAQSGGE